jgi:NADPH-dependent curcumin reductase CurA
VYFENVGGKVFDAVLPVLNRRARISLCGVISQYAAAGNPRELWQQAGQRIFDERSVQVHDLFVGNYVADGNVVYREDRWEGLEKAPEAFSAMLQGGNFGKTIVVVGAETT